MTGEETGADVATASEPEGRGRLVIDRAVLRKIVEHVADAEPDSVRVRRRVAGVGAGEHGASARVSGPDRELRVRLDVALRYPAPVAEAVTAMRERIREELHRAAGCHARSIDVTVSKLLAERPASRVE